METLQYLFDKETRRKHPALANELASIYARNLTFGIHDSSVSVIGVLSGMTLAGFTSHAIFIMFLVGLLVQATSDGVASYFSERASGNGRDSAAPHSHRLTALGALTITVSFILNGLLIYLPYFFIANAVTALQVSVSIALFQLFILGYRRDKKSPVKGGLTSAVIGGVVVLMAALVGLMYGPANR